MENLAAHPAARAVVSYLRTMERRDLPAAKACLAPTFAMHFPGTPPMSRLEDLVGWATRRFRCCTKVYEGFDVATGEGGATVVFARGTLVGERLDGTAFADIRFLDRFTIGEDGLFLRQDVWNDLAEYGIVPS